MKDNKSRLNSAFTACCKGFKKCYGGPWYRRILVWMFTFVLLFLLFLGAVDINFLNLFGKSPGFSDIKNPSTNEASEIYSADSVLIGRFYNENRTPVKYEDLPAHLIHTLIDTEDERYYEHHGIDVPALFAAIKDMAGGHARGASTITQQLAKNLFRVRTQYSTGILGKVPGVKLLIMKVKEWIVALKLEYVFSKQEILTMYFNTVDFGNNSYGIKTASNTYFGKEPKELSYEEAATLVGLLKATSTYNPKRNPKNSTNRRNIVLTNLYEHGHLIIDGKQATPQQLDSIKSIPMKTYSGNTANNKFGPAPYFTENLAEYIDILCEQGLIEGCDSTNRIDLYADGLKIYTTLDTRMQAYAEEAVRSQMRKVQKNFDNHWGNTPPWQDENHRELPNFIENLAKRTSAYKYYEQKFPNQPDSIFHYLNQPHKVKVFSYDGPKELELSTMDSIRYMTRFMHCGFVAIEPQSGAVKAWVGDIDFGSWQYDKVTAMRQPGSTFKLFVYTEAMNQGLTPCDERLDEWKQYPDTIDGKPTHWTPHNADGTFSGANIPLKSAFAQSINSIAVRLGYEVGIHNVAQTAHAMGIKSPLQETPALSLGASDVNLLELTNSYCTVINDGKAHMPLLVNCIKDRNGTVIYQAETQDTQAIPYRSAYFMQYMLRAGMSERGATTAALWSYIYPVADLAEFGGKTGTSNNHSDAWFVGVTPKLVVGAWVGGEYRSIHFRTGLLGQGSRTALPICGSFFNSLLKDKAFLKYRAKFPEAKEHFDTDCFNCESYIRQKEDTLSNNTDSITQTLLPTSTEDSSAININTIE